MTTVNTHTVMRSCRPLLWRTRMHMHTHIPIYCTNSVSLSLSEVHSVCTIPHSFSHWPPHPSSLFTCTAISLFSPSLLTSLSRPQFLSPSLTILSDLLSTLFIHPFPLTFQTFHPPPTHTHTHKHTLFLYPAPRSLTANCGYPLLSQVLCIVQTAIFSTEHSR